MQSAPDFLWPSFLTLTLKLKSSQSGDHPRPGVLSLVWCLVWCGNCDTFFALKHRWELEAAYIKDSLRHTDKALTARLPFGTLDHLTRQRFVCWIFSITFLVASVFFFFQINCIISISILSPIAFDVKQWLSLSALSFCQPGQPSLLRSLTIFLTTLWEGRGSNLNHPAVDQMNPSEE